MLEESRLVSRIGLLVVGALTFSGCAPLSPTPPFHFLETAEVLKKDEVGITLGAGGGGIDWGGAGGGTLRLRAGLGGGQELGVEGTALYADTGHCSGKCDAWIGQSVAFATKLAYKVAPTRWLAFLFGAGLSTSAIGTTGGGDAGLVISAPTRWIQPYAGARFTFGVPIARDVSSRGGFTPALVAAGGFAIPIRRVRIYGEAGYLQAWPEEYDPQRGWYRDSFPGGYAAAGVQVIMH
jgi:hypothetical protein